MGTSLVSGLTVEFLFTFCIGRFVLEIVLLPLQVVLTFATMFGDGPNTCHKKTCYLENAKGL